MKKLVLCAAVTGVLLGCESGEMKEKRRLEKLAALTCESSRDNRTKEELQAIGEACFRRGTFHKSTGREW